mmetsp:Transcript_27665/g.60109  ORF Transcript_27665/g.60109 Transcript_27665/m.60109 type:complete len:204 (-) Transcript_27665:380-991(-)
MKVLCTCRPFGSGKMASAPSKLMSNREGLWEDRVLLQDEEGRRHQAGALFLPEVHVEAFELSSSSRPSVGMASSGTAVSCKLKFGRAAAAAAAWDKLWVSLSSLSLSLSLSLSPMPTLPPSPVAAVVVEVVAVAVGVACSLGRSCLKRIEVLSDPNPKLSQRMFGYCSAIFLACLRWVGVKPGRLNVERPESATKSRITASTS